MNAITSASAQSGHVHWVLAEFNNTEDFLKAVASTRHTEGNLPFVSSMCWFDPKKTLGTKSKSIGKGNFKVPIERLNTPSETIDFSKTKSVSLQPSVHLSTSSSFLMHVFSLAQWPNLDVGKLIKNYRIGCTGPVSGCKTFGTKFTNIFPKRVHSPVWFYCIWNW